MGLRVCLVTPFAWSRPHDVNEHVAGVAHELRDLGHEVTVLAPSTRAADLIAGRRARGRREHRDIVAEAAQLLRDPGHVLVHIVRPRPGEGRDQTDTQAHVRRV